MENGTSGIGHGTWGMERILGSFAHYFQRTCLIPIASVRLPIAQQLTVTLTVQIALLKFRQDLVDKLF
jgi:hypothetical protein